MAASARRQSPERPDPRLAGVAARQRRRGTCRSDGSPVRGTVFDLLGGRRCPGRRPDCGAGLCHARRPGGTSQFAAGCPDRDFRLPGHRPRRTFSRFTMPPARRSIRPFRGISAQVRSDPQGTEALAGDPATRRRRDADPGTAARRWVPGTARRSSPDRRASDHGRSAGQCGAARRTPGAAIHTGGV